MSELHALYRFFDHDGLLLYVGITNDLGTRLSDHRRDKPWWAEVARVMVAQFESREAVLAAEKVAIRTEQPKYNVAHNETVLERQRVTPGAPDGRGVLRPRDVLAACLDTGECLIGEVSVIDEIGFRLVLFVSTANAAISAVVLWRQVERIVLAGPADKWGRGGRLDLWPLHRLADYWEAHRMPRFQCAKCEREFFVRDWNGGGLCAKCWEEEVPF